MERFTEEQETRLLQYLDGQLSDQESGEIEQQLAQNHVLKTRFEDLRQVHVALREKARLENPSRKFTDLVMDNLDRLPQDSLGFSKSGLLLLCGMLVAMGALAMLQSSGVYDNLNSVISFDELPVSKELIRNSLPSLPFSAKWLINGIMVLGLGLAFIVLDRTVLKPYFERRSQMPA